METVWISLDYSLLLPDREQKSFAVSTVPLLLVGLRLLEASHTADVNISVYFSTHE